MMPLINNFTNRVTRPILEIRNLHFYAWPSQAQAIQKRSGFIILSMDQATLSVNHLYCICIILHCVVLYCIGDKDHIYALLYSNTETRDLIG